MTELLNRELTRAGSIARVASMGSYSPFRQIGVPQIMFAPDDEGGSGSGDGNGDGDDEGDGNGDEGDDDDDDDAGKEGEGDEGDDAGEDDDESGGKPTDREARLLKESLSRKKALKTANKDLASAKAALKRFDGIDPDKVRKLLKDQQDAEATAAEARGEYEESKRILAEAHASELETKDQELTAAQAEIKKRDDRINELTVGSKFSSSKFVNDELVLTPTKARQVYGSHFAFDDDGDLVAYDRPADQDGRKKVLDKKTGEPADFETAMRQIIDADSDRDHLLRKKVKGGAGSGTQDGKKTEEKSETYGLSRIEVALAARRKK